MRLGSLFAGIGGFDLAARWMGWETAWFSEVDPYASAVLAKHWPGVPNHGDITAIDFTQVESVDMLVGGFPCQDISNAGKRAGIAGERSGLWGEYARAIGELRPRYVVVENVAALLGRGVERVLGDLAALGYDAEWQVLSAADVGAPHLRERLWIMGHAEREGLEGHAGNGDHRGRWPQSARSVSPASLRSRAMADAQGQRHDAGTREPGAGPTQERRQAESERFGNVADAEGESKRTGLCESRASGERWRRFSHGDFERDAWAVEPDMGRVAHGVPARVDRLTCLGNSLVPRCAFAIFQEIEAAEERERVS